jgi:phosphatidate phosphatase APP1
MFQFKKIKKFILFKLGKPTIINYRGYGNHKSIFISGRIVKSYGLKHTGEEVKRVWNILAMIERYMTPGISGVELEVKFKNQTETVITDDRGFFEVCFTSANDLQVYNENWIKGSVRFLNKLHRSITINQTFEADVLIPATSSEFGVISDIDDTFLISYSTSFFLKIKQLIWKNAFTRKAFSGASTFYNALLKGFDNEGRNPFFYVSSSDWNLYDLLVDFCEYQGIPKGVFFLNDFRKRDSLKLNFWKGGLLKHGHKMEKILTIFETYPDLKFILLGDSGQKDAEIYKEIAQTFPDRILSVYIRDIGSDSRRERVLQIANELNEDYNITMLLMEHSDKGAKHALAHEFVAYENVKKLIST